MEEGGGENDNLEETQPVTSSTEDDNSDNIENSLEETLKNETVTEDSTETKQKDEQSVKTEKKNPEERLCGWLYPRPRGLGPLKTVKQRWYHFGDENCKLYCYRAEHDLVPLSEINIATASFDFDAANIERPGLFQIKSDGKEYSLDAGTRQNMFYWLQALQMKRREFNLSRVYVSTDRVGQWSMKRASNLGGLLSKETGSTGALYEPVAEITSDLPEIRVPDSDAHSSNSSLNSVPHAPASTKPALWPLNNLKTELTQKWSGFKLPGRASKESQQKEVTDSVFYCDLKAQDVIHSDEHLSISSTSINSDDSLPNSEINHRDAEPVNGDRDQTGSQLSPASDISIQTDQMETNGTQSVKLSQSAIEESAVTSSTRNTGSWSIVTKKDVADLEIQEAEMQNTQNSDSRMPTSKVNQRQSSNQGQSAGQGQIKESGKQGKIMSTFSSLRKISRGRRNVPETGKTSASNAGSQGAGGSSQRPDSDPGRVNEAPIKNMGDLEDELQANREIISILQQKLLELTREQHSREVASGASEDEKTAMLVERDRQILDLQTQLDQVKHQCHQIEEKLTTTETEVQASIDQVSMYCDMLKAKDEIISSLTDQFYKSEQEKSELQPRSNSFDQPDVIQSMSSRESTASFINVERSELREMERYKVINVERSELREMERYKDMCQGYELQHKFLTKEILELNDLRKDDLAREKKLMMDFAKMQAKYYQIKSKYYVLLKQQKEQSPVRDGEEGQEVVSQLLQDALEADTDDLELRLTGSGEEYDRYGFSRKHYMTETEEELDEDPLVEKAAEFERQHEQLSTKVKDADRDASLRVKWENYMVGRGGKLQKCQELKMLIRQGVPHEYREEVWKGCINFCVSEIRAKLGPDYYESLLERKAVAQGSDPSIKQIELDLLRTLPNNKHYESIDSEGIVKLRRVLLAFSEYNRIIGYCQGLNRLAAIALLFLNEEDAFWCLVAIVDHILPAEYFSTTLMAAQADQRVLKDLVKEKLPSIYQKLEANQVDLSLFTFNWFLTIFVDNIPTEMFLRIWDTFLYEGSKVLFRFATSFLKKVEGEILKQKDGLELNRYLRKIGENMTNVQQICEYAFDWINPFPMRFLANKRQYHLQIIRVELSELDKIRRGIKMERAAKTELLECYSDDDLDN